jgi:hypothetical protein
LGAEPLESLRVLLDMNFDGNKPLFDQRRNALIGIDLGIQPSTSRSHGSGTEIQQHVAILLFRF